MVLTTKNSVNSARSTVIGNSSYIRLDGASSHAILNVNAYAHRNVSYSGTTVEEVNYYMGYDSGVESVLEDIEELLEELEQLNLE